MIFFRKPELFEERRNNGHKKNITATAYDPSGRAEKALFFDTKLNKIGSSKTEIFTFESKNVPLSPTTLFIIYCLLRKFAQNI